MRAVPVARVVMPLVLEAHRNAVLMEGPELLDEVVIELARPLSLEKLDDRSAALKELRAITPAAVRRVSERDPFGVACVPGILGSPHLLLSAREREGRKRRTRG